MTCRNNLTSAGQQHVDDLDTYLFHVEPKRKKAESDTLLAGYR